MGLRYAESIAAQVTDGLVPSLTTLAPETVLRSTLYHTILCQFYTLRLPKPHPPVVTFT